MLIFQGETAQIAEEFLRADPYVTNGIVTSWRVREWTTVVGAQALTKSLARPRPSPLWERAIQMRRIEQAQLGEG